MSKQQSYNGWPNYETWNVMLWMDNEEGAYRYYRNCVEMTRRARQHFTGVSARATCGSYFGDKTPDGVNLESSKIRWGKIAEAMRER